MTEQTAFESPAKGAAETVEDVMHRGVVSLPPGATLRKVAEVMANRRIHCVVVRDDADSLWGVVSDLDLVAGASVRPLDAQTAGSSAATPAVTVPPNASLQRAADLMIRHAVSHLVVVDPSSRRPVGIISSLDLAEALADRA